jgi:hypothetical protein
MLNSEGAAGDSAVTSFAVNKVSRITNWTDIGPTKRQASGNRTKESALQSGFKRGGYRIRTGDRLDHNQELYQLSYSHHAPSI